MTLLEARGLNKAFGSVIAADNITVSVAEQEVIGVIGANGAGKTTFVNMVTGYLKPDAGAIWYQGEDITRLSPRQITGLGISRSFQVPQVFMSLSLYDNLLIAFGLAQGGALRFWRPLRNAAIGRMVEAIIERYGMGEYSGHAAGLLPQGVRKLLDIAMATAHNPKVILLDEPTSGVSVNEKFGIMDVVMGALKETGVTVLFIEHDMEIVARYGQRVLAFSEGTVLAKGTPQQVLKDAQVRRLVIGEDVQRKPKRGRKRGKHA